MRKITNLAIITIVVISIPSCSKTSSEYLPSVSNTSVSTVAQLVKVRVVSDWQNMPLIEVNINGVSELRGQLTFTQIMSYEAAMHKRLAYVKIPSRNGYTYKALPTTYITSDGNHALDFAIDFASFGVRISNSDFPSRQINAQDFLKFQYRYIVIPIEVYQSFSIDWTDLSAVAASLNFSL